MKPMKPIPFELNEIATSLMRQIKELGGEDYVAVRIRGETLWEVVRPKSPELLAKSLTHHDEQSPGIGEGSTGGDVEKIVAALHPAWFATDYNHRQAIAAVRKALRSIENREKSDE